MTPKGLRTIAYKVNNIKKATEWYAKAFEQKPYFEEPFYVGFNIGGYELGLMPTEEETKKSENILTYWGVEDIHQSFQHFLDCGAKVHEQPINVGGELMAASVKDPWDNIIGLIYNPYFKLDA
jgi:predicted enzyme related to lactoylglutathione lyase